jgi:superfamily II DNA or RNA helicase
MLAMERVQRNTLVIVPTLDLVNQWKSDLERSFGIEVGVWGGGERSTEFVTVSTYDSAHLYMEYEGNRFGFLIFDECHHLPGPSYQWIAKMSIAPYRLGLSATPERQDGGEQLLEELIGPMSFRIDIQDLKGHYLSDYETELIEVPLSREELEAYQGYRKVYTEFLHAQKIDFSHASAWTDFLNICFKSEQGRAAYDAYRKQKEIIRRSDSKLRKLWDLLFEYREEQIIIFTNDNEAAYHIGELFILPVLTHHTKLAERKRILDGFRSGRWPWLVTSKVLNEGVDVPQVNVGIIVSGSGSVREHVQRLGRLLRKHGHEKAKLIELISQGTAESYQSQRRRSHSAYRNS